MTAQTALEELVQFVYLAPVGIVRFRQDGTIDMMNPVAAQLLLPLVASRDLSNAFVAFAAVLPQLESAVGAHDGEAGIVVEQHRHEFEPAEGSTTVLSVTVHRINRDTLMATLDDITRIVEQERQLVVAKQQFGAIFDHVRDYGIFTMGLEGRIDEWNQSLLRFGGWRPEDVLGQNFGMFFPIEQRAGVDDSLALARRQGSVELEGWCLRRDESLVWVNAVITALPDDAGAARGFVVVARDLSERKKMEDELRQLATTDPLTGALNRRSGSARILQELQRHERYGHPAAVLLLDIDHFKAVNDRLGHAVGDEALKSVVATCGAALRETDAVIRWGGEEFVILLSSTGPEAAATTAERLRAKIASTPIDTHGAGPLALTVSIGVAGAQRGEVESWMRRADTALYFAKESGRNRVVVAGAE